MFLYNREDVGLRSLLKNKRKKIRLLWQRRRVISIVFLFCFFSFFFQFNLLICVQILILAIKTGMCCKYQYPPWKVFGLNPPPPCSGNSTFSFKIFAFEPSPPPPFPWNFQWPFLGWFFCYFLALHN